MKKWKIKIDSVFRRSDGTVDYHYILYRRRLLFFWKKVDGSYDRRDLLETMKAISALPEYF